MHNKTVIVVTQGGQRQLASGLGVSVENRKVTTLKLALEAAAGLAGYVTAWFAAKTETAPALFQPAYGASTLLSERVTALNADAFDAGQTPVDTAIIQPLRALQLALEASLKAGGAFAEIRDDAFTSHIGLTASTIAEALALFSTARPSRNQPQAASAALPFGQPSAMSVRWTTVEVAGVRPENLASVIAAFHQNPAFAGTVPTTSSRRLEPLFEVGQVPGGFNVTIYASNPALATSQAAIEGDVLEAVGTAFMDRADEIAGEMPNGSLQHQAVIVFETESGLQVAISRTSTETKYTPDAIRGIGRALKGKATTAGVKGQYTESLAAAPFEVRKAVVQNPVIRASATSAV